MKENASRTLHFLFKQYKTPIVPYFSISNSLKLQPYFILAFQIEKKTAVTYFSIFNIRKLQPYLNFAVKQYKTAAVP